MKKIFKSFAVSAVLIGTFFLFGDGFWTEVQKNSYRTGRADTVGMITNPEILWKYYRGGHVSPSNVTVDDDGNIYFSLNGIVKAVDPDLNQLWESQNFGATKIFKIIDLDKNGKKELVVGGTSGIRIVSAQTGSILSTVPTESPAFAKIADINDDGFYDIVVRDRWGEAELKAYSFSSGTSSPALLWEIYEKIENFGIEICVGDLDDNGTKEIIVDRMSGGLISVFNSSDGTLLRDKTRVFDGQYAYGFNQIINLDADNQKEFVFSGMTSAEADRGSYSITVYDFVEDAVQWQYEYGWNTINKGLQMVNGSIRDFNNDGIMDIAVSVFNNTLEGAIDKDGVNAPGIWTTLIYQADNGVLEARLDNTFLEGFSDLNGDGTVEFILRSAPDTSKKLREYSTIYAYGFTDGDFKKLWSKDKVKVVRTMPEDTEDTGVVFVADVPATVSIGNTKGILVIEDINRDGVGDRFFSMSGTASTPALSDIAYLLDGKNFEFISATDSTIYLSGNDGFIHVFNRGATLSNEKKIATGNFIGDAIFINSASGGKIITTLSTYSHLLLDFREASSIKQPELQWSQINQYSQPLFSFDSNGDGLHEFISLYTDSDGYTDIYLHGSNGGLIWGWTIGKIVSAPSNFISGDFDGDGFKDVAFTFSSEEEGARLYTLKGLDGSEIGSYNPATYPSVYYSSSLLLLDGSNWSENTDKIAIFNATNAQIIEPSTSFVLASFIAFSHGYNSSSTDFTGNGESDLFANQRTDGQKQMFNISGDEIWKIDISWDQGSLYQYSAPYSGISKIDYDDGFDVVIGGKFGDISAYSGTDGSVLWRKCLSDGVSTDISTSVIPTRILCDGTTLSNIVTGDIDGNSIDEFVVGDKLGNLYVLNSKDGTLVWTMGFDSAIGNPVLADVNSDEKIEIVIGAGDGYLYAIGQKLEVPATAFVRDVELNSQGEIIGTTDIDEMLPGSFYGGSWEAVPAAVKYEIKLTDEEDNILKETQINGANQVVFNDLLLSIGDKLYLSVKTINAGGYKSEWVKSDGITVVEEVIISDTDSYDDADIANDIDSSDDVDPVQDVDLIEDADTDHAQDADDALPDNLTDENVQDKDSEISDNDPEVKSKSSGCGCSII